MLMTLTFVYFLISLPFFLSFFQSFSFLFLPLPPPPPLYLISPTGEHLLGAPGVLCVPAASPQPGAGGVQRSGHPGPQPEAASGREGVHPAALQIPADPHREGRGRLR